MFISHRMIIDFIGHQNQNTIDVQHRSTPISVHKMPGTIDVIGGSVRDQRRPQPSEFRDLDQQDLYVFYHYFDLGIVLRCCSGFVQCRFIGVRNNIFAVRKYHK